MNERSNQPPKPEGCLAEGRLAGPRVNQKEQPLRSVFTGRREPQAGGASGLSNSASKESNASGEGVVISASNTKSPVRGEGEEGLSGSKSVASVEGSTRNEGSPERPCRTNYEGQAGRQAQRQGVLADAPGVGLAYSSQQQGASPEAGQEANSLAKFTQATSAVRLTELTGQPSCGRRRRARLKSPVRENRPPGSVRGAPGNRRPYRDIGGWWAGRNTG